MGRLFTIVLGLLLSTASFADVKTVARVDLEKYLGTWYEIERFPNSFQEDCLATKAEYSRRPGGKIDVKNTCKTKSGLTVANGIATVEDTRTNAKLKVSFVPFLNRFGIFAGDYWILALADDYSSVLVGHPERKYLWVLARTPTLSEGVLKELRGVAVREGFDVTKLKASPVWD